MYFTAFDGFVYRFQTPAASARPRPAFPRTLTETGLFASVKDHTPAAGLIPYTVNVPLWSDGAEKERYLALPGDSQIEFDDVIYPHGPNYADRGWRFPDGAVLLTGTGVVPPDDFTLMVGDDIAIEVTGIGRLLNRVE